MAINCFEFTSNNAQGFINELIAYANTLRGKKGEIKKKIYLEFLDNFSVESKEDLALLSTGMSYAITELGIPRNITFDPNDNSAIQKFARKKFRDSRENIIKFLIQRRKQGEQIQNINSIGNAKILMYGEHGRKIPGKGAPMLHPTTLYVFNENLQAFEGESYGLDYEKLKHPTLDVSSGSESLRATSDKDKQPIRNENTAGLVVKRNAEIEKAKKSDGSMWVGVNASQELIEAASLSSEDAVKYQHIVDDFITKVIKATSNSEFKWAKEDSNGYEVSSTGDEFGKNFSALRAKFKPGTIITLEINGRIETIDAGDRTIEDIYQHDLKKSGKRKAPSEKSSLRFEGAKEAQEDFSYYNAYLPLWMEWAKQNPDLINKLREKAKGKTLTDSHADTRVNQARALADILAGSVYGNIWIPERIALDKAGLPQNLCEYLQNALYTKLGIVTNMQESELTKGKKIDESKRLYGLVVENVKESKNKNSKTNYRDALEEARKSLEAEKPTIAEIELKGVNILSMVFPDIYRRRARVNMMTRLFLNFFDDYTTTIRNLFGIDKNGNEIPNSGISPATLKRQDNIIRNGLKSDKEQDIYRAILSYKSANGDTVLMETVRKINFMIDFLSIPTIEQFKNGEIPKDKIDGVCNLFYYSPQFNNYITNEYNEELKERGIIPQDELEARAKNLIMFFSQLKYVDGLKDALIDEVFAQIDKERDIQLSRDNVVAESTAKEVTDYEDESTGNADTRNENLFFKWKVKDPIDTITTRIKNEISDTYQMHKKDGKYVYERNEFGLRIPNIYEVSYYKLQEIFAKMNTDSDLDRMIARAEEAYPWFRDLSSRLTANPDLKREFYRNMRNAAIVYGVVSPNGRLVLKNTTYTLSIFLDNVGKNYEGHSLLSELSLYDAEGKPNYDNIKTLREVFNGSEELQSKLRKVSNKEVKDELYARHAPMLVVLSTLSDTNPQARRLENAYKLLTDKESLYNFENILRAIGIDTDYFDLEKLLPTIDQKTLDTIKSKQDWDKVWTAKQRQQVFNILRSANVIISKYGSTVQNNLLTEFKSAYRTIGTNMISTAQTYTSLSFWDSANKNRRSSYTKPDKISEKVNTISNTETPEDVEIGTNFLQKEYLDYDLFKDFPLIQEYYDNPELRKELRKVDLLYSSIEKKDQEIARVSIPGYYKIAMSMYELEMKSPGTPMAYYLNILYSDAEAMQIFRMPRITGNDFREKVVEKLSSVAYGELKRIVAFRNNPNEVLRIHNFNDKGDKSRANQFCFMPELNKYKEQLIKAYDDNIDNNDVNGLEGKRKMLSTLSNLIQEEMKENFKETLAEFSENDLLSLKELLDKAASYDRNIISDDEVEDTPELNDDDKAEQAELNEGKTEEQKLQEAKEAALKNIIERLERFYYNDYYANTQLQGLLFGDLAFADNARAAVKRAKQQCYSAGEKIYGRDNQGRQLFERTMYINDRIMVPNTFDSIKKLLEENVNPALKDQVITFLKSYVDTNSTDGQGFRTLKSIETIFEQMGGVMTPRIRNAFTALKNGKLTLDCWDTIVNAFKPLLVSSEKKTINGRTEKVIVQHKNSEYLLTALYTAFNTAYNHSPEYRALQHFMEAHNIDAVQFESVVKLGLHNSLNLNYAQAEFDRHQAEAVESINRLMVEKGVRDKNKLVKQNASYNDIDDAYKYLLTQGLINYDTYQQEFLDKFSFIDYGGEQKAIEDEKSLREGLLKMSDEALDAYLEKYPRSALANLEKQLRNNGEENAIETFPLEDIMFMQPSGDHMTDAEGLQGSQLRNIAPADLPDKGDGPEGRYIAIHINGEEHMYTKKEVEAYNEALLSYPAIDSYMALKDTFKDDRRLKNMLLDMARKNAKYGEDVIAALKLESDENIFEMPFNAPVLKNKMTDLIMSSFKNNIQRRKIKGGNAVLATSFSTKLKTVYKPDGSVLYMECYLNAFTRDFLDDYLIEQPDGSWLIDFKQIEADQDEELLRILGYRIPTEQKYSAFPLRIVGFMPESAGSEIMLPAEAVTMSGFDFDIDKLFLMIKEYQRSKRPAKMAEDFIRWAEIHKRLGEVDENLYSYLKVQDEKTGRYEFRKRNFNTDEIQIMYDNFPIFKEFYDTLPESKVKYEIYRPPIVRDSEGRIDLVETVRMRGITDKEIRRKTRNNMYIDFVLDILSSKEGSALMMLPATYKNIKLGARMSMNYNNTEVLKKLYMKYPGLINKYGIYDFLQHFAYYTTGNKELDTEEDNMQALDDFYSENATLDKPCSFTFRAKTFKDLMDGNALIGVMAVNSSRHYKLQSVDQPINPYRAFTMIMPDGREIKIDQLNPMNSPIDGNLSSYNLSQEQAASPDNGKDPNLGKQGISIETSGQTTYMAAIGIPLEFTGFLNAPEAILNEGLKLMKGISAEKLEDLEKNANKLDIRAVTDAAMKSRLGIEINQTEQDVLRSYTLWWNRCIMEAADDYRTNSAFMRADSPNGALSTSLVEAIDAMMKVRQAQQRMESHDFSFPQMKNVINLDFNPNTVVDENAESMQDNVDAIKTEVDKAELPILQTYYSCGIKGAADLVEDLVPEMSTPFVNAIMKLSNVANYINESSLKNFINSLTTYELSSAEFVTKGLPQNDEHEVLNDSDLMARRNFYIHDFPMQFKEFFERKEDGKYVYADIRNLTIMRCIETSNNGIKFNNIGGKTTQDTQKYFREGLMYMQSHPLKEVREMATHLMMYAFFDNGFLFGPSNFGSLYTTPIVAATPGYIQSIRSGNEKVLSNDTSFLNNYIMSFLLNNHKLIKYFRKEDFDFTTTKNGIIVNHADKEGIENLRIPDPLNNNESIFRPLIRKTLHIKGHNETYVLYFTGLDPKTQAPVYEIIDYNKTDIPYYNNAVHPSLINWSELQERGKVIAPDKVKEYKEKEERKEEKDKKDKQSNETELLDKSSSTTEEKVPQSFISGGNTVNIYGSNNTIFLGQNPNGTTINNDNKVSEPKDNKENSNLSEPDEKIEPTIAEPVEKAVEIFMAAERAEPAKMHDPMIHNDSYNTTEPVEYAEPTLTDIPEIQDPKIKACD